MKLKESIESDEYGTLNAVKGLLRRYEKYRVKSIWMCHTKYAFLIPCKYIYKELSQFILQRKTIDFFLLTGWYNNLKLQFCERI